MRRKAREYAVQALYALDLNPSPVDDLLSSFWEMHPCKPDVEDFATTLVKGTIRRRDEIDDLITNHSSNWKLDRMAVTDRNILRLGTFELLEESTAPPSVIINEAIEIAKKYGSNDSATFINGVLDSIHQKLAAAGSPHVS